MWNPILVRLEIVLVSVQDRYTVLRRTYHRLRNRFGRIRWFSLVTRLKWKLDSVHLEIVLILRQDRCTVHAERTIGSEIVLDMPDGTPGLCGSCGILLRSVWR
jgi:hypothetical protein